MKNPKIIEVSKSQAQKLTAKVCAHWKVLETSWFELGRLVDECLQKRVPAALGMNAQAWMAKCVPGSESKAWRALRVTRALKGVPEKEMRQLSEGNAVQLSRLPEKVRKSKEWVLKAKTLPNEEFREAADALIEKKTGIRREEMITLRLSMPRAIYDQFEAAVQKMARISNIDLLGNEGRRIMVYERMAALVNGLNEDTLKNAVEGGE
jgi:hypothetical protein